MTREPSLDELIENDVTGAERQRLQHAHDLLIQAGPPPELPPELAAGPTLGMTLQQERRRPVKPRALMLLAAALVVVIAFFAGYAVSGNGGGSPSTTRKAVQEIALRGTAAAPDAQAQLQVWRAEEGNSPMTLVVEGLPKLAGQGGYEVYLVRDGRPWGSCGTFRMTGSGEAVTVTLNAPYSLRPGDSWIVTRPGAGSAEPGRTVLRPVKT